MVYNRITGFFGLCLSSGILETRKYNLSDTVVNLTGVVLLMMLALSKGLNRVCVFPPRLRTATDPVSETLGFLVSRISDDRRSLKKQKFSTFQYVLCRFIDRLCGLVVRVPGYRFRGHGFDSRRY
jgi:hypothetical protein